MQLFCIAPFKEQVLNNNKINWTMNTVLQKQRVLLARPKKQRNTQQQKDINIFAALRSTQPLPLVHKIGSRSYDLVGTQQFRDKYTQSQPRLPREAPQVVNENETDGMAKMTNSMMNTTINRHMMMTKMTREQTNMLTKEVKQLHRYREYHDYWNKESKKLHKKTLRNVQDKTLLEDNVKGVYVHPNQDRADIINNFVVNMWQMSLRNHNKILQRHIKGHKFEQNHLEELLQTDRGIKAVERSIPALPLEKLKQINRRELSLTGRSKALSETHGSGAYTERRSLNQTPNQEEVYKINYTGNVKWMSVEGL